MKRTNVLNSLIFLKPLTLSRWLLLIVLASIFFRFTASAEVENKFSLLSFQPERSQFQAPLSGIVTQLRLGNSLKNDGNSEKSTEIFNKAIEEIKKQLKTLSRGYHDELYFLLGYAYEQLEADDDALHAYHTSLDLRGDNPLPLFKHAQLLIKKGHCGKALSELDEVSWRIGNNQAEVLFLMAKCQIKKGEKDKAVSSLETASKKDPSFAPAVQLLADTRLADLNKKEETPPPPDAEKNAITDLKKATALTPDDRESSLILAALLIKQSDPLLDSEKLTEAQTIAKKFAEKSDFSDEKAVRLLFDAQLKKHDLTEAAKTIENGLKKNPKSQLLLEADKQLKIEKGIGETIAENKELSGGGDLSLRKKANDHLRGD